MFTAALMIIILLIGPPTMPTQSIIAVCLDSITVPRPGQALQPEDGVVSARGRSLMANDRPYGFLADQTSVFKMG